MEDLLAHSARPQDAIPAQAYRDHVNNVARLSVENAIVATGGAPKFDQFIDGVSNAAEFHDLGKVDMLNQRVLSGTGKGKLPVNHVDAGVAYLRA